MMDWSEESRQVSARAGLLALAGLLMACGGKAVIDGTASGEGGSAGTTTTSTHAGGQGGGSLTISLSNIMVTIGCKPGYEPPDPVQATFSATYSNGSSASATASIVGATISLGGPPSTLDWSFQVSPASVGPVPGNSSEQVDHAKVDGSGSGSGVPCDFCSSPGALLEIDYLVDGQSSVAATGSGMLGCLK